MIQLSCREIFYQRLFLPDERVFHFDRKKGTVGIIEINRQQENSIFVWHPIKDAPFTKQRILYKKTNIMKFITTLLILTLNICASFAQQKNIRLLVVNDADMPVAGATVTLLNIKAAAGVTIATDQKGLAQFHVSDTGSYHVNVSAAGMQLYEGNSFQMSDINASLDLGKILLQKNLVEIATVTVTSKKKFIEIQADKTVLNIEGSINAVGNSAFELIKKGPGVTADKDENLKLKGGVATIYIDGKPSYLSGEQLVQYLKNLPSDAISKIELIGNPGSKYDAAGSNGIINIRLKKNKLYGTNGNFSVGTGYGKYPKLNSGLSLNHRTKNLNVFTDLRKGYSESFNELTYNSIITNAGTTTYQDRNNYWNPVTNWLSYKAGADYSLGKNTIIGVLVKGSDDNTDAVTNNETIFKNAAMQQTQNILTTKDDNQKLVSHSYNLNFKQTLDSLGSELSADADYINYNRTALNTNYNNFTDGAGNIYRNPYIFRNGSPAHINIKSVKTDYTKVWSATLKMEAGFKYSYVKNENLLSVDSIDKDKKWHVDFNRTNNFIYTEQISAGYLNFTKDWKKISVQVGLRAEHTKYQGNSTTLNLVNDSSYFNLFPSAFITYKINDKNTLNASYSRRINRPSYQSLNPFISYIDPYTQFEGNPNLKPSFTQSFEVKHNFKDFLYSTLSYSYTKAQTTNVILQDNQTGAVRNITANVGNSSYISLNESASVPATKWWSIDNSVSFNAGNNSSTYPGYEFNQPFFGIDLGIENSFQLSKTVKAQLSGYYSTPYKDGITRVRASYGASAGVQKTLWSGKANLKLNYNNFIGPSAYRSQYLSDQLNIKWVNRWEGKRVNLSFNYKFGNKNVKSARQRNAATGAETNRVNL
ncbi:outer membrane beta-barrel family protein [soil metagenome]